MCLDNASDCGVEVRMGAKVEEILFENNQAIGVRIVPDGGKPYEVHSKIVVDASGRRAIIGTQLGLKDDVPGLNKASLWSYYHGGKRLEGIDAGETTVFMIPDCGWFWYIPLPEDMVSIGIVASPEYLFLKSDNLEIVFLDEVERCMPLKERLSQATRTDCVRGIRKLAYRNHQIVGDGWVMVGDAAAFLNPIYSSGLFLALGSAELVAKCVHDGLKSEDVSAGKLGGFVKPLEQGVEVIKRLIFAFYDPVFSFGKFIQKYPEHRLALVNCLVGDVINRDMSSLLDALDEMSPTTNCSEALQDV